MAVSPSVSNTLRPETARTAAAGFAARTRLLGAALLLGLGGPAATAAEPAGMPAQRPVQVVKVAPAPAVAERSYTGTVRARIETDMAFRVAGKVAVRHVDVGERVAAGQVLAELDPEDYRLALQAAEAEAAAAGAAAVQAVADEGRYRALLRDGHVSQADYDRRKAAAVSATERQRAAERQRDLARNRLDHAVLRADAPGTVTAVAAEVGQVLAVGTPMLRIARTDAVEAVVAIPEGRLEELRDARAEVSFWAAPGRRLPAMLRELSPEADPVTRTHLARFSLPVDAAPALGATATVHLSRRTGAEIRLPRSAVVDFGRGPQVWTVDAASGKLTAVPVALGALAEDTVSVSGALEPGDLVVAIGAHRLDGSEAVKVAEVRP